MPHVPGRVETRRGRGKPLPYRPRQHDPTLCTGGRGCEESVEPADDKAYRNSRKEKARIDEKNVDVIAEGKVKKDKSPPALSLPRDQFFLLRDLTEAPSGKRSMSKTGGVLYYSDDEVEAQLTGPWKEHVASQRAA